MCIESFKRRAGLGCKFISLRHRRIKILNLIRYCMHCYMVPSNRIMHNCAFQFALHKLWHLVQVMHHLKSHITVFYTMYTKIYGNILLHSYQASANYAITIEKTITIHDYKTITIVTYMASVSVHKGTYRQRNMQL